MEMGVVSPVTSVFSTAADTIDEPITFLVSLFWLLCLFRGWKRVSSAKNANENRTLAFDCGAFKSWKMVSGMEMAAALSSSLLSVNNSSSTLPLESFALNVTPEKL